MLENNLLSLSYGRIVRKNIDDNDGLLPESFETYQIVEADDLVWRLTDLQNDKRSLRTALVSERGIITSAYLATRPTGVAPSFLNHLLRAYDQLKVFYSMGGGLRQSMKFADVRYLPILLPPSSEQLAIAAFLDHETAKIDALVEEQRQLVALLKDKRQAVISHAVTKGLDLSVPIKDSGIEWLGQIPAHWVRKRIKHVVTHIVDCLHTTPTYEGELAYPAIRTADVERGRLVLQDARLVSREIYEERIQRLKPEAGDILYSREGERFGMAALVPCDVELCLGQRMMMFRASPGICPDYVMWVLNSDSVYKQVVAGLMGATSPHVNISDIRNFAIPIPPIDEQIAIAREIDSRVSRLDDLTREAEAGITLLQERRAALISAAVTGKIDVQRTNTAQSAVDPKRVRDAVGAEIIRLIWRQPTFGRVKFHKLTYLAETHVGIPEIGGRYDREAAGPYDRALMQELETNLKTSGLADIQQPGGARAEVSYRFTGNEKAVAETAKQVLGSRLASLHDLIKQLGDMQTDSVEAVATLYAVWNDILLDGQTPDEQALIKGVLQDWHPEKGKKFKPADLTHWLDWMRRHEFTPKGQGPRTTRTHLII
jgi:type I restriction enzyme S subunit